MQNALDLAITREEEDAARGCLHRQGGYRPTLGVPRHKYIRTGASDGHRSGGDMDTADMKKPRHR